MRLSDASPFSNDLLSSGFPHIMTKGVVYTEENLDTRPVGNSGGKASYVPFDAIKLYIFVIALISGVAQLLCRPPCRVQP